MKKYIIFSIILIVLLSLFVYIQDNSLTTLTIAGLEITLPNALWTAIFLTIFLLFTIIFFLITQFKTYFYRKAIQKDIAVIIDNIKNHILYKTIHKSTKILNDINNFTKNIEGLNIKPEKTEKFEFLEDIKKLKNGEVIEISKYKLNENNPWFILNIENRLNKNPEYAKEVLKKFKNEKLKEKAFYIFAKTAPIKEILRYPYEITFEIVKAHLKDNELKKTT